MDKYCNILESSNYNPELTDRPRERPSLSGPYQGQGPSGRMFAFPRLPLQSETAEDTQGSMLCAQLGGFHFTPQYSTHGGSTDEPVNVPTAIIETSYVHQLIWRA